MHLFRHFKKLVWFAIGDSLWKLNAFVVIAVVSRTTPKWQAAAYVLSQTVLSLYITTGDLGFRAIGTRLIASNNNLTNLEYIYKEAGKKRLLSAAILGVPVAIIATLTIAGKSDTAWIIAFLVACWSPYFAFNDWALHALKEFRLLTYLRLLVILCVLFGVIASYLLSQGIWPIGVGYCAGFVIAHYVSTSAIKHKYSIITEQNNKLQHYIPTGLEWRPALILGGAFALNGLFHGQEILITGRFLGQETAASFAAGLRIILLACSINWIVTQFATPYLALYTARLSKSIILVLIPIILVALILTLILALFASELCSLIYGRVFPDATIVVKSLTPILLLDAIVAYGGAIIVMNWPAEAAVVCVVAGCLGSIIAFVTCVATGLNSINAPIVAKYCGYISLLSAQCIYLFIHLYRKSGKENIEDRAF